MWRQLKPYLYRQHKVIVATLLVVPFLSGLNLFQPILLKIAIDDYILQGNWAGLRWITLGYLLLFTFEYALNLIQVVLMQVSGQRIILDLRRDLFAKVQALEAKYFDQTPVGVTLTRLTGDCEAVGELFSSGIVSLFWDLFRLGMTVVLMAILDWRLTLVTFSVIPLLLGVVLIVRRLLHRGYDRVREALAALNVFVQEHVGGLRIIQLFRKEEQCFREFASINLTYRNANMSTVTYDAILYAFVEALASISVGLMIWYGAGHLVEQTISIGVLVAFIEYINRFFTPIRDLSSKFAVIQSARVALNKIRSLLDRPLAIYSKENARAGDGQFRRLELKNVSFQYESKKTVLEKVNLIIKPGDRLALVGLTGSGKSTLLKLLNRTYDITDGAILLDGTDIRDWNLVEVRRLFGVVPQEVCLFSGTILDNIRLFDLDIPVEKVVKACQEVKAHEFIMKFPEGYNHRLTVRALNLSMGERQLIALARAILFDMPVLLLDEATAHLDPVTASRIQESIAGLSKRRTLVLAAHRLNTVRDMSEIIVIHQGQIKERGTHQDLADAKGIYRDLFRLEPLVA